ncbi:MAG: ABC transporter substrate-binding protein [Betaproteobacteria bacterium]|nr:MAG: ABC transporter substrate-binding protein [Betaproteobacteria bacterium]TMH65516.1 MAG: ABC transporter substrate-binding protein [Betaproteobacteria bacterium]
MKTQLPATFNARLAVCAIFATAFSTSISAEPAEITIAKEYGIGYLPYMIMENNKLVEKHAAALGLKDMKINWQTFGGSGLMQSAMIAGRLDFASSGVPWFLTMWDKLNGQVKSPGALDSMPIYLNTRNPNVKTIRDFTEKDKIALPAVKSSIQAITLQMAATAMFGSENVTKLDTLTVSLSHPDAMNALLSGISEIDSHFASSPFQELELKDPRIHRVLSSYDLTGGQTTFIIAWTSTKFHDENPKTYQAFVDALLEAQAFINSRPPQAAKIYLAMSGDKRLAQEELVSILGNPDYKFTNVPQNIMKYAEFMLRSGSMKKKPASWKDLFFPNVHDTPGS